MSSVRPKVVENSTSSSCSDPERNQLTQVLTQSRRNIARSIDALMQADSAYRNIESEIMGARKEQTFPDKS